MAEPLGSEAVEREHFECDCHVYLAEIESRP